MVAKYFHCLPTVVDHREFFSFLHPPMFLITTNPIGALQFLILYKQVLSSAYLGLSSLDLLPVPWTAPTKTPRGQILFFF